MPFELGDDGYPIQYRGSIAGCPGLYIVGLPFQHSFTSMLIRGMGKDAERVVSAMASDRASAVSGEVRRPAPAADRIAT